MTVVRDDWPVRIFVTGINSETLTLLDRRATDRNFLFTLNAPASHTAQVADDDVEINRPWPTATSNAMLTNNKRLLFAFYHDAFADPPYQPLFSGIIDGIEDQGADAPTGRYTAHDPWQLLMSRPFRVPVAPYPLPPVGGYQYPAGTRASDIALEQLLISEIADGETFIDSSETGLIEDSDPFTEPMEFEAGISVGECWQQLCDTGYLDIHMVPMYEPVTAPAKLCRFKTVRQAIGTAAGPVRFNAVMGWDLAGHSLADISNLVDGTRLANNLQFFAGEGGVAAPFASDAASIAEFGNYWSQQFFPGSHDRYMVGLIAVAQMLLRRRGVRSISFDPAPERSKVPPRDYWLGDYLPLWASRNLREPLGIDYPNFDANNPGACGYQRVYAIPMQVDDNGVVRVRGVLTAQETT